MSNIRVIPDDGQTLLTDRALVITAPISIGGDGFGWLHPCIASMRLMGLLPTQPKVRRGQPARGGIVAYQDVGAAELREVWIKDRLADHAPVRPLLQWAETARAGLVCDRVDIWPS